MAELQEDLFKEEFKRYKRRCPPVDLSSVVDPRYPERFTEELSVVACGPAGEDRNARASLLGLNPPHQWQIYQLSSVPGLLVIPNPFQDGCQHRWVRESLVGYPCKPNVCNLDAHQERRGRGEVWPGELASVSTDAERPTKKPRLSKDDTLYRLRWVTLGYHYNWNTKEYDSQCKSPFPADLNELSRFIVEVAGFPGFVPEAAIVNYYHLDSTLSGHTDHSEHDLSIPLLSISFGQSAIFLVGGKTRTVRPKPFLLNSGDVIIMSGDSRLAYHGVPRIVPPPPDCAVPVCLTLDALRQSRSRTGKVINDNGRAVCCVCGRVWREDKYRQLATNSESCKHNAEATQLQKGTTPPVGPSASGHCMEDISNSSDCASCQELLDSWPMFISYLSVSRININVRQVVSASAHFDY